MDNAYRRLKELILTCELAPGTMVAGQQLAPYLGMSRTPVNEALKMLCVEGLVEVIPRIGYRIAPLTIGDVQEIFQLRLMAEPYAVEQALSSATDLQLQGFRRTCFPGEHGAGAPSSPSLDDPDANRKRADLHDSFHIQVASLSGSMRLVGFIRGLLDASRRIRILHVQHLQPTFHTARDAPRSHVALADAILERDREAAVAYMAEHVREAQRLMLAALGEGRLSQPR